MYSLYDSIKKDPVKFKQLNCGEVLITKYDCPLEKNFDDTWSHHNYIVYVIEGRKIWHTSHGSYDLRKDSCVLIRKGASIIEQFFDTKFCLVVFFLPDEFICDVLKTKKKPIYAPGKKFEPIIPIDNNEPVQSFFHSMMPYFDATREPDQALLELKFRELILTIADNSKNAELLSYFCSLLQEPQTVTLQRIMEDNFSSNLKLEEFARLTNRSLSAFKRDFQRIFGTTPGKWLLEKRLNHAMHLLSNQRKTVSEASFEAGFENQSHFSRAFRKHFGFAPATVKQKITI
ncbi:helix-turn-helix domain-containing protein [Flavihumibacter fluvii]|uniref:helix-turn-helix domain-containing protein n=1 Tax=Flavihumibacter fluvii TaxID=2838157 RepID=UPI001BDE018A|nr:AraC family transcriptional regulator [Flavihumibacter fluvii]ULQ53217.1 AraC family transcriptional regulator [Flavihumibacter fluvii]